MRLDDNGIGVQVDEDEMPDWMADEIAQVGIAPSFDFRPVGYEMQLGRHQFAVIGHVTKERFIEAARAAFPSRPEGFEYVPTPYFLQLQEISVVAKISVDKNRDSTEN